MRPVGRDAAAFAQKRGARKECLASVGLMERGTFTRASVLVGGRPGATGTDQSKDVVVFLVIAKPMPFTALQSERRVRQFEALTEDLIVSSCHLVGVSIRQFGCG